MLHKLSLIVLSVVMLSACTTMKVAKFDPETNRFPTKNKATIVKSDDVDLDSMNDLLLMPENDFVQGQLKNINYFKETMTYEDLEIRIVQNDLSDKVPSVTDRIGINKAYKAYKPFLWFRIDSRSEGNKSYVQFILTNPSNLEDIFIAEQYLDYVWGVNDQTTWYPLFNAVVDYIEQQSNTWTPADAEYKQATK